jgi:hypothetical protein
MLKMAARVREKGTTVRADNARIFALASSCFGSACRGLAPKVRQLKEVRPASRFFSTTSAVQLQDHDGSADRFMKIKPEELISNIKTYKANHQSNTDLQDLIEQWDEKVFYSVGTAMGAGSLALAITLGPVAVSPWVAGVATFLFWKVGYTDLQQDKHTIRRNFPVLGRMRYLLEMFRRWGRAETSMRRGMSGRCTRCSQRT